MASVGVCFVNNQFSNLITQPSLYEIASCIEVEDDDENELWNGPGLRNQICLVAHSE